MNFYQYNLDLRPAHMRYAVSYLMKLMSILLAWNQGHYTEMARLVYRTATKALKVPKEDLIEDECRNIVADFEDEFFTKSAE